jgi:hypothetical protein
MGIEESSSTLELNGNNVSPDKPVLVIDPVASAKEARLRHVHDNRPGIRRERRGKGFRYLDADGQVIRDPEVLGHIASLAIPPSSTPTSLVRSVQRSNRAWPRSQANPARSCHRKKRPSSPFSSRGPRQRSRVRQNARRRLPRSGERGYGDVSTAFPTFGRTRRRASLTLAQSLRYKAGTIQSLEGGKRRAFEPSTRGPRIRGLPTHE